MAVKGADKRNKGGLEECSITEDSRTEYVAEIDWVQQFISDTFYRSPGLPLPRTYVYKLYAEWAENNGREIVEARELYGKLRWKGWKEDFTDNAGFFKGYRVIEKNPMSEGDIGTSHPQKSRISPVYIDMDLLRQAPRRKQV